MSRCIIITSCQSARLREFFDFCDDDFIICADGGYSHACTEEIRADVLIGDFDSLNYDDLENSSSGNGCRVFRQEIEKDYTDTMICLMYGIKQGFNEFYILGGLGGRLDHTVANLQVMSHAIDNGKSIWILDGRNRTTLRNPGSITIQRLDGYKLSLLSYSEVCDGITITGVKYPLTNRKLNHSCTLGISNEFIDAKAKISHKSGKLLIILSQD
ncbi:MAG: thiamine diphosphokinase [Eubacteriales bacterium]|nr:thiamine diphosphokinase [Eubacteriales bacterium]